MRLRSFDLSYEFRLGWSVALVVDVATILVYVAERVSASAVAISAACGLGEVRARLVHLEILRHVVSRPDELAKPLCRVFLVTAEGWRTEPSGFAWR